MLLEILMDILSDPFIRGLIITGLVGGTMYVIGLVAAKIGWGVPAWLILVINAIFDRAVPRIIHGLEQRYKVEPLKRGETLPDNINQILERTATVKALKSIPLPLRVAARLITPDVVKKDEIVDRVKSAVNTMNEERKRFTPPTAADMKGIFGK